MIKCPKCGKAIDNDSQFCGFCGAPIAKKRLHKPIWITLVVLLIVLALGGIGYYIIHYKQKAIAEEVFEESWQTEQDFEKNQDQTNDYNNYNDENKNWKDQDTRYLIKSNKAIEADYCEPEPDSMKYNYATENIIYNGDNMKNWGDITEDEVAAAEDEDAIEEDYFTLEELSTSPDIEYNDVSEKNDRYQPGVITEEEEGITNDYYFYQVIIENGTEKIIMMKTNK